jgi:hypothetical protein
MESKTIRIRPSSRDELPEFAVREQRSIGNVGAVVLEMGTQATEDCRVHRTVVEVRDSFSDRWVEATARYLRRVARRYQHWYEDGAATAFGKATAQRPAKSNASLALAGISAAIAPSLMVLG